MDIYFIFLNGVRMRILIEEVKRDDLFKDRHMSLVSVGLPGANNAVSIRILNVSTSALIAF